MHAMHWTRNWFSSTENGKWIAGALPCCCCWYRIRAGGRFLYVRKNALSCVRAHPSLNGNSQSLMAEGLLWMHGASTRMFRQIFCLLLPWPKNTHTPNTNIKASLSLSLSPSHTHSLSNSSMSLRPMHTHYCRKTCGSVCCVLCVKREIVDEEKGECVFVCVFEKVCVWVYSKKCVCVNVFEKVLCVCVFKREIESVPNVLLMLFLLLFPPVHAHQKKTISLSFSFSFSFSPFYQGSNLHLQTKNVEKYDRKVVTRRKRGNVGKGRTKQCV
jgi:hypothetical protein